MGKQAPPTRVATSLVKALRDARGTLLFATGTSLNQGQRGVLFRRRSGVPIACRLTPDHSIWDHLDLTSAFAGAFAGDPKGEAALLVLSLGPVQSFIAAARSTSDLWAGSHLLSRLAWEAMKPVCERLGPDAILFPRLRGVPQVDLWLRDEIKLSREWFKDAVWQERATDANRLFAAALPNRFVALVPASQVSDIAGAVTDRVRAWLQSLGNQVVERLLGAAGLPNDPTPYAFEQLQRQLEGFLEVHWAAVPFSLIRARNPDKQTDLDIAALTGVMAPFSASTPESLAGLSICRLGGCCRTTFAGRTTPLSLRPSPVRYTPRSTTLASARSPPPRARMLSTSSRNQAGEIP